jgi:hypothetical protein
VCDKRAAHLEHRLTIQAGMFQGDEIHNPSDHRRITKAESKDFGTHLWKIQTVGIRPRRLESVVVLQLKVNELRAFGLGEAKSLEFDPEKSVSRGGYTRQRMLPSVKRQWIPHKRG